MKQNMMIIGAKIKSNSSEPGKQDGIIEIVCIPLATVKAKSPGLFEMMKSGVNMESIMKQAQGLQQFETRVCISIKNWVEYGFKIGRHITVEVLPDNHSGGVK